MGQGSHLGLSFVLLWQPGDEPQDDLLDVLFWSKVCVAISWGIIWGVVGLRGLYAFLGFLTPLLLGPLLWLRYQECVGCLCMSVLSRHALQS